MRALTALSVMMMLALAGCSSPSFYWYHPDRSLDDAQADYLECQDQARHKAADMINEQHYDRLPPTDSSSSGKLSLTDQARYTNPGDAQDAWRQQYEQSVVTEGMRAKGYLRLGAAGVPHGMRTKKMDYGAIAGR